MFTSHQVENLKGLDLDEDLCLHLMILTRLTNHKVIFFAWISTSTVINIGCMPASMH